MQIFSLKSKGCLNFSNESSQEDSDSLNFDEAVVIDVIVFPNIIEVLMEIVVCLFLREFVVSHDHFVGCLLSEIFGQVEKTTFGSISFSALNGPLFDQGFHQKITLIFLWNLTSVSKVVFFVASWETLVDQALANIWLWGVRPWLLDFVWSVSL